MKQYLHLRPAVAAVCEAGFSVVKRHGGLHKAQTDAGTFAPGDVVLQRIEAIEYPFLSVVGNARAFVFDS